MSMGISSPLLYGGAALLGAGVALADITVAGRGSDGDGPHVRRSVIGGLALGVGAGYVAERISSANLLLEAASWKTVSARPALAVAAFAGGILACAAGAALLAD